MPLAARPHRNDDKPAGSTSVAIVRADGDADGVHGRPGGRGEGALVAREARDPFAKLIEDVEGSASKGPIPSRESAAE